MPAQPGNTNSLTVPALKSALNSQFHKPIALFLFCLILAIPFFSSPSFAQYTYQLDKTTRFEKIGAEDGLSTDYTTCIHQDKYGFIWIGTQTGLNLYSGDEIIVFNVDPKNPKSLFNNFINSIYEEPDGTMWFCTAIGISKYNRANQTFTNYIPDTIDLYNSHNNIQKILQDGDFLWLDVWDGLYRFNKQTGEFKSFAHDTLNPSNGDYDNKSKYVFLDGTGILWVSADETGRDHVLSKFDKETGTFVHYQNDSSDPESFSGKQVMSMIEDIEGTIWIATLGSGLLEIIDKDKGIFRQYAHDENDRNSIIDNNLEKVFEDAKGNIWTGGEKGFSLLHKETGQFTNYLIPDRSDNPNRSNMITDINENINGELWLNASEGIFRFNPSTKVLIRYLYDPDHPDGISENNVRQLMNDNTGQAWMVTWSKGINRINQFSNAFRRAQKKVNVTNSLSGNSISRFFADSKGNFWVGCFSNDGLNRTKINEQKIYDNFEHFVFSANDPKSISGNAIRAIYEDQDHILWFGTQNGLNSYDYNTNSFKRFQHDPDDNTTISSNDVESIFQDSQGVFWVGTRNGLNIMNKETGKFIRILPDANDSSGISNLEILVIFEDSFKDVWFGGVYLEKLDRKDTSFISYMPDIRSTIDKYRIRIWGIAEDNSANLWISSGLGGLYKFARSNSSFSALTMDHGLPSNSVYAMEIDNNGDIWITTNKGLSRINHINNEIKNYDVADGLINLDLIDRSLYKDPDGWLYCGGRDGFNVFHPDSLKENKIIPPVYITNLTVAGQQKYFDKPLFEMANIDLQYDENDFSFDFVALNYINAQKNEYAYMLEGYDEDWNYAGNRRTAYYTNLSPGKYTFRVKGSNNDGYWNEEGASLAMIIYPPFWKTWWAYMVYAFAFFVLVYLLRRNELRKINLRRDLELEHLKAEHLAELDIEKNKFFSNISHEFRTPLTLILGPLEKLIGSPKDENQKEQLNMVRRNARRLQALINQLLSLSKLESGKMKLKARPENIVKLSKLFIQSFHSMAQDRGIKLEFESDAEEYIVYLDILKFEKIANNLLSNAFKFTPEGGKISVTVTANKSLVFSRQSLGSEYDTEDCGLKTEDIMANCTIISIADTGAGIPEEDLPHVFDRFYQVDEKQMKTKLGTGIGLALTKELVELHHGSITVESEPGTGTTFTVFLQLGKDHLSEDEIFEPATTASQTEDELLNDYYLFAEDNATKAELNTEKQVNDNLPLILIVEDNEDMRSYIKSYLVDSYNIIEATNGKEGAERAIEHIPDLIVSDLMMPKLDGNEMTLMLKTDERTSHIPIILLTAKASKESKLEGLETGADDFLTKPFDADELLVRINNLVSQRKRLREVFGKKLSFAVSPGPDELKDSGITSMDEQFMKKAFEIAEREMSDPEFGVLSFSSQMGMSRMQLHRKLKALTDQSATEFIKIIRLNKAAVLLKSKSATAAEIAYDVGFNSPTYFSTSFKEHFGKTPLEYAKQ